MILALESHEWLFGLSEVAKILFVFALGACVGSLTNVLVYRLPLGISVVTPPSRCPKCSTRLRWNDNIPVFGWIFLKGRCRYCRVKISGEYPLVEAFVGLLFVLAYVVCYLVENPLFNEARVLGVDLYSLQPSWAEPGMARTWPVFLVLLTLLSCLVAMTIVDAKTFTIPLVLTWVPAIVAVVAIPGYAFLTQSREWRMGLAGDWSFIIPSPGPHGWKWVGVACGGMAGLGVSVLLLRLGLLKQSFADLDAPGGAGQGAGVSSGAPAGLAVASDVPDPMATIVDAVASVPSADAVIGVPSESTAEPARTPRDRHRGLVIWASTLACAAAGGVLAPLQGMVALGGVLAGALAGPIVAGVGLRLVGLGPKLPEPVDSPADDWLEYPHARREVIREIIYLGPCISLAIVGAAVAMAAAGPWKTIGPIQRVPAEAVPLWLDALSGVFLGYLIGGGVVWAVRILGSLLFGKEAMGLGDVHMMAAVGACLGWIDPTLAFFMAAFVGVYREAASRIIHGAASRAMPFGPSLAIATALMIFGKPWIESGINAWLGTQEDRRIELP